MCVTNNLGKTLIFSFLLMVMVAIAHQENFEHIKRLFHIVAVLSVMGLIVDRFLRKVAYKIIIDFDANTIEFYMCRSGGAKKYGFHLIKTVSIKKYATFVLENGKILYNHGPNEEFKHAIDKLKMRLERSVNGLY